MKKIVLAIITLCCCTNVAGQLAQSADGKYLANCTNTNNTAATINDVNKPMTGEKKPETATASSLLENSVASCSASATGLSSVSIGLTFDAPVRNTAAQAPIICKRVAKQPMQSKKAKASLLIQTVKRRFFNALVTIIKAGNIDAMNLQDEHGNTAMHYAVMVGSEFAVKTLASYGARSDIPNNDGLTPLDIADTRAEFFQHNLFARIALYLEATDDNLFTKNFINGEQQKKLVGLNNHQVPGENQTVSRSHQQTPVIPSNYRELERYLLHLQKDRGKLACMIFYSGRRWYGDISYCDYRIPFSSFLLEGHGRNHKSEFAITHKYLLATVATVNHALLDPEVSKSFVWHDLLSLVNKYIGVTMGDAIWDCEQRWGHNTDTHDLLLELDEVIAGYTTEKSSCVVQ